MSVHTHKNGHDEKLAHTFPDNPINRICELLVGNAGGRGRGKFYNLAFLHQDIKTAQNVDHPMNLRSLFHPVLRKLNIYLVAG